MKTADWITKQNRKTIELVCDECGTPYKKAISEYKRGLRTGRNKSFCSISCSISNRNRVNPPNTSSAFDIGKWSKNNSQSDNCTPFKYYLKKAKSRKWETDLDCEYLNTVWSNQMGKCAITNIPIVLKTHTTTSKDLGLTCASLDRIDSSKGYVKGNVQFVCVAINLAKGNRSDGEIKEFLRVISGDGWNYEKTDIVLAVENYVKI